MKRKPPNRVWEVSFRVIDDGIFPLSEDMLETVIRRRVEKINLRLDYVIAIPLADSDEVTEVKQFIKWSKRGRK